MEHCLLLFAGNAESFASNEKKFKRERAGSFVIWGARFLSLLYRGTFIYAGLTAFLFNEISYLMMYLDFVNTRFRSMVDV